MMYFLYTLFSLMWNVFQIVGKHYSNIPDRQKCVHFWKTQKVGNHSTLLQKHSKVYSRGHCLSFPVSVLAQESCVSLVKYMIIAGLNTQEYFEICVSSFFLINSNMARNIQQQSLYFLCLISYSTTKVEQSNSLFIFFLLLYLSVPNVQLL